MTQQQVADIPVHPDIFAESDFRSGEARLYGTKCGQCNEIFFPRRLACPRCHSAKFMSAERLAATGRIHALTHVARPAAHYPNPYMLALIDLEGGPRILAQVKDSPDDIRIGDSVELLVEPLFDTPDGRHVWGYRFKRVSHG